MKYFEFGQEHQELMVMLPGGGVCYRGALPVLQGIYIFFLTGFSYWLIGKSGPIRKKIVCKMMDRTEESFDRIVYKDATWQSWVNQDKCTIGRHITKACKRRSYER